MEATTSTVNLSVSRFIKAPRERVFAAWTKPDEITKWLGPENCRVVSAKLDPRVDGQFRFRIRSDDMGDLELFGVYREVQPPNRLVFTWNLSGESMEEIPESQVTVDFVPSADGTDVQIMHEDLANPSTRDDHNEGWNGSLVKLSRLLVPQECTGPQPPVGTFCWNELLAKDVGAATTFYNRLFEWETADSPMGDLKYKMFKQRTTMVGGAMAQPTPQTQPQWVAYVRVADVDGTARKTSTLGGKVILGPQDIPTVGRIAIIQDPQGATLGLYAPAKKT